MKLRKGEWTENYTKMVSETVATIRETIRCGWCGKECASPLVVAGIDQHTFCGNACYNEWWDSKYGPNRHPVARAKAWVNGTPCAPPPKWTTCPSCAEPMYREPSTPPHPCSACLEAANILRGPIRIRPFDRSFVDALLAMPPFVQDYGVHFGEMGPEPRGTF